MKNPFIVLGLRPELVKALDDESILSVAKSVYRQLQKKYHPDLNKRSKKNQ